MAFCLAVAPSGGSRTWTVVDDSYRTVLPVEEWLEFTVLTNAVFPNGLCIYGAALAPGHADEWITIQTE